MTLALLARSSTARRRRRCLGRAMRLRIYRYRKRACSRPSAGWVERYREQWAVHMAAIVLRGVFPPDATAEA